MNLMFWKQPERMQRALVSTEDGRVVDTALPVELGYLIDKKMDEAYIVSPSNMIKCRKTGEHYVIVDERDGLPALISDAAQKARDHYKKNINLIGHENWRQGFYSSSVDAKKAIVQVYLATGAVGLGVVMVVMFLLMYFLSGKLHIGSHATPAAIIALLGG
jgi:hypothetical protein